MINLKNYEEWFLTYADNELSASEKESVMAFLVEHPELRQEFDCFLSLKCLPDHRICFPNKEMIYIPEEEDIASISFSPDLSIVYPNKSSLYKSVPVQKMSWLRPLSIAASLFFMIGLMWWMMQVNREQEKENTNGNQQGISGLVKPLKKNTSPVSVPVPTSGQAIAAASDKVKAVAINYVSQAQKIVLQADANKEVAVAYHSPEPAVERSEETPAVSLQTNFSSEALAAGRERLNTNLLANSSNVVSELTERVPVNAAILIEDAIKQDDQNIFRGIIRRINRVIQDDAEEPEKKFIQVANFQIPVKQ
jgi:hypothetical protein